MTLRQELVKEIARKIDRWNWPIWDEKTMGGKDYDKKEDCLIEWHVIDKIVMPVKKFPIYWDSDNAIWRQVEEINAKNDSYTDYLYNLSSRAEQRLINDIRKRLRYKIVRP